MTRATEAQGHRVNLFFSVPLCLCASVACRKGHSPNVDTTRIKSYTRRVSKVEEELYFISVAAEMLGMHPQTLRKYERLGLIQPSRTIGSMRLYSREEIERVRLIKHLVDEGGINLAGVQRLLSIVEVMQRIRPLMDEGALNTGAGRRQLMNEMRRLNDALGL